MSSANPLHGPRRRSPAIPPFLWPAQLEGHPRRVESIDRCWLCGPDAHPQHAVTFVTYGGRHWCREHARAQAALERRSGAAKPETELTTTGR